MLQNEETQFKMATCLLPSTSHFRQPISATTLRCFKQTKEVQRGHPNFFDTPNLHTGKFIFYKKLIFAIYISWYPGGYFWCEGATVEVAIRRGNGYIGTLTARRRVQASVKWKFFLKNGFTQLLVYMHNRSIWRRTLLRKKNSHPKI